MYEVSDLFLIKATCGVKGVSPSMIRAAESAILQNTAFL
jgi:hypothetical protein